jgi:DNA invertase Pin-like site-specific DNA recombinase
MAGKRASPKAKSEHVFGQARKRPKMFRAGLYARVSTNDQQTLPIQSHALREYAARRDPGAKRERRRSPDYSGWARDGCNAGGISKSEIARRVQIGRTSVRRILRAKS